MIIPKGTVVTIDGKVYRTLEAQVAWNKEELESLDIEALEALPDQFTELQENVSALGDSVADVTEDVGGLESDMTDAQSDISGLKTRMTTAETNIGTNAGEISQLQFDVGQAQGDITALGTSKLNKPTNTGEVGDVIVKTAGGTEYQSVAPFNPNATYPNVTAGKAISAKSLENVSEDSGASQDEPFFFQATATANNTAETPTSPVFNLKSIRGNTIVYNQLVDGMSTSYATISGHTYWAFHSGQPPVIVVSQGTPISFPSPQSDKLVDLTRWFNGSIPQAILDDPTVFPVNYYDGELTYSAGELKNCSCTELKTVGFNQFDKSTAVLGKLMQSNGTELTSSNNFHSDFIECIPNTVYYFKDAVNLDVAPYVVFFDADKNVIEAKSSAGTLPMSISATSSSNARYMIINGRKADIDTINVNLHWDGERDGEYAPYTPHTYPLVWSGKSANFNGTVKRTVRDERLPDGTEITRIGEFDMGQFTYSRYGATAEYDRFFTAGLDNLAKDYAAITMADYLSVLTINAPYQISIQGQSGKTYITTPVGLYADGAALKAALSGVIAYVELKTPTTSEGTPYTSEIEGDDYGTMSFDSIVPVGNEFFYPADYSLLIDDLGNYTGYDVTSLAKKSDLIPAPVGDGTYTMKAVVSGGTVTYTWEAVS